MGCGMDKDEKQAPPAKGRRKAPDSPADRPRVNAPRAIADLMPNVGRAAFRKFGFIQSSIVSRWAEIVGARHAEMTSPESIRFPAGKRAEGTLTLTVASGHAPIVQHILPDIIARVNRFFGYPAVAKVAIRQGMVPRRAAVERPLPATLRPVPADLGEGLRTVSDPELRAVLESLAKGLANSAGLPKIG